MLIERFKLLTGTPDGLKNKLVKDSFFALILKIAGLSLGYLLTLFAAYEYGAGELGSFILGVILINVCSSISVLGLDITLLTYTTRLVPSGNWRSLTLLLKRIYTIITASGILLGMFLYLSADILSIQFFSNSSMAAVIRISAFGIVPFTLIRVNAQLFRGLNKINLFMFLNSVVVYAGTFFMISAALLLGINGIKLISFYFYGILIGLLSSFIFVFVSFKGKKRETGSVTHSYKHLAGFSAPIFFSELVRTIRNWSGQLIIGYFMLETQVGVFTLAQKMASVSGIILLAVNAVAIPRLGEFYGTGSKTSIQQMLRHSARLSFRTSVPVNLMVILFSYPVLYIIGKDFTSGIFPLILLSTAQSFEAFSGSAGSFLQVVDKQKTHFLITSVSVVVQIIISILLIPLIGITGAAAAIFISTILQVSMFIFFIRNDLGFKSYYFPIDFLKKTRLNNNQ